MSLAGVTNFCTVTFNFPLKNFIEKNRGKNCNDGNLNDGCHNDGGPEWLYLTVKRSFVAVVVNRFGYIRHGASIGRPAQWL